jgi:hypothetical protein
MQWQVLEVIDRHSRMIERCKSLGRVDAPHQPAALLAAFKKFDIKDNERQRNIAVRKLEPKHK